MPEYISSRNSQEIKDDCNVLKRRLMRHKIPLTFVLAVVLAITIYSFNQLGHASSNDPYDSGYTHGCDDARVADPSDRYINQPEKGPSFHTKAFMDGYYVGYNACSGSDGDGNDGNSDAVGGSLRVIESLDVGTYGDQYCDSRTFDMRAYIQTELAQEKIVAACDGQETTFSGLDVPNGS